MDAKKFGQFIAELRKEQNLRQAELAHQLHVTNKAISRWERGLGFTDITTIEPLAKALHVSVNEIMTSKRIIQDKEQDTDLILYHNTITLMKRQQRQQRIRIILGFIIFSMIFTTIMLFPFSLSHTIHPHQQVSLFMQIPVFEDGQYDIQQYHVILEEGTLAYMTLQQTLDRYSYHLNFSSLMETKELSSNDPVITLQSKEHTVTILKDRHVLVDNRFYTLGYCFEQSKKDLYNDLIKIIELVDNDSKRK